MTPRISRAQAAKNGSKGFTNGMESLDLGPWRDGAKREYDPELNFDVLKCPKREARGYGYGQNLLAGGIACQNIEWKERL